MNIGRKICTLTIALIAAALLLCAAFLFAPITIAENPAPVTLAEDSVFAVSPTHVVYTCGSDLSIVDLSYSRDPMTKTAAFEGTAIDVEITSNKIAVLSQGASGKNLKVYSYSEEGIGEELSVNLSQEVVSTGVLLGTSGEDFLLLAKEWLYNETQGSDSGEYRVTALDATTYENSTGFALISGTLYFAKDTIYRYMGGSQTDVVKPLFSSPSSSISGMAQRGNFLFISCDDGIYRTDITAQNPSLIKLSGMSYPSAIDIEGEYLYAFDKDALAIKRYEIGDTALKYNKCYDAEVYLAPTEFDIVQELRPASGDELTLYRSPRDLEVVAQVTGGIIALKKVVYDGGDGAASYYYCVTQEGEYGYVLESTGTLVPLAEAGFTAAQPLHGIAQTPVYNFPYKVSGSLCTLSTDENGSVVMTRGEESAHVLLTAEGTLQAGGVTWCKVLISEGENLLTGYMDARFVCPYVSYSPANVHDYCKIDSGRAGVYIKLYSQPSEEAEVVAELPDNTELLLAAPYDEESVWTCVFYGDSYAYVLTENITVSALTTVQITLIVVLCALVVPGVALCAVIYIKRKKKREYNEEN